MKNLLIIISLCLSVACTASQQTIQNIKKATPLEQDISVKQENKITPQTVIEEKIPDSINGPIKPKKKEASVDSIPSKIEEKSKLDSVKVKVSKIIEKPKIEAPQKEIPKIASKPLNHNSWNVLLNKHVSKQGNVNYKGFKQDIVAFRAYLRQLSKNMPTEQWSKQDKMAYWLNVYNAYTVKLIVDNYPIESIKDIKKPWDLRFFKLGKKWYTLNDVEHRILRKMGDPKIHFGINCASFSCPSLPNKAFTGKNVNQELKKLTVAFINDPKHNTITANKIEISKIFSWFAKDFKRQGSIISFLNKYSKTTIQKNASKSFKTYDWNLNE